ncbi:MAG: PcfJ domain-containing protein [Prevotellaceae bacterium]|nr:PcfJ domain-containing protein [Candidatus Colivivens equi]
MRMQTISTFKEAKGKTLLVKDSVGSSYYDIDYYYDVKNDRLASLNNPTELARLKGNYFLFESAATALDKRTLIGEPGWDERRKCVYIKIGHFEQGRLVFDGTIYYSTKKGLTVDLNKSETNCLTCVKQEERRYYYNSEDRYKITTKNTNDCNYLYELNGRSHYLYDILRQYYRFSSTGVILNVGYNSISFAREKIPTKLSEAPAIERYSVAMNKRYNYEEGYSIDADLDDCLEVEPLDSEECQEAIRAELERIAAQNDYCTGRVYGADNEFLSYQFTVALGPNPAKGARRPIGHIYARVQYGDMSEIFCIGYGKLSETGEMRDIYLRNSADGKYYRVCNRYLTSFKELVLRKMTILSSTLDIAKNLRNKELISTIIGDNETGSCSLSSIQKGAKVRHSALFIEQLLKLGYKTIADSMINEISNRHAWNESNCLGDLIPGADENAKNIYDALGLKKGWAKWVLAKAIEGSGSYIHVAEYVDNARLAIACGFDSNAPSKDAMLVAETIHNFKDYHSFKSYCGDFQTDSSTVEKRFNTLYADPKSKVEIMKTYNRMVNKINKACPTNSSAALRYYSELFDDYCGIKSINRVPEDEHVFIEFGLSDENNKVYSEKEINDMLHRISENASAIYHNYESEINANLTKAVEEQWKESRKAYRGYTKEIDGYLFIVPSTIYGNDDYSIRNEGNKQQNCVYRSYAKRVAEGSYQIVLMRKKSAPKEACVTIGINSAGVVDQTYTYKDARISPEHGRVIKKWVESLKNTKKAIKLSDYNPAGWCIE